MCQWGTHETVRVHVAAELSHSGMAYWKDVYIDACLAEIVRALQVAGIDMLASCCGHGKALGRIDLVDGRVLFIGLDRRVNGICANEPQPIPLGLSVTPVISASR